LAAQNTLGNLVAASPSCSIAPSSWATLAGDAPTGLETASWKASPRLHLLKTDDHRRVVCQQRHASQTTINLTGKTPPDLLDPIGISYHADIDKARRFCSS